MRKLNPLPRSNLLQKYGSTETHCQVQIWRGFNDTAIKELIDSNPLNIDLQNIHVTPSVKMKLDLRLGGDDNVATTENGDGDVDSIYENLIHFFLIHIDSQFNIISDFKPQDFFQQNLHGHPHFYIRDATHATSVNNPDRLHCEHPVLIMENLLLRELGIARAINFVLQTQYADDAEEREFKTLFQQCQIELRTTLAILLQHVFNRQSLYDKIPVKEWYAIARDLEKRCNNSFCDILHRAGLTEGIRTQKDFEKLLLHYRNMAAVLSPACVVQTITFDEGNGVYYVETAYPVTKKTQAQISLIQDIVQNITPTSDFTNYHCAQAVATQIINKVFQQRLTANDRMLGAQARKMFGPTIRNAYVCEICVIKYNENENDFEVLGSHFYSRSATIVYIGKGETDKRRVTLMAKQNLEQLHTKVKEITEKSEIHCVQLITYTGVINWEDQDTAYQHTIQAITKDQHTTTSYIPTDPLGTVYTPEPAKSLQPETNVLIPGSIGQRDVRTQYAVNIMRIANQKLENTLNHVFCMSGQDRTSTVCIYYVIRFIQDLYKKLEITGDREAILASAFHNPVLLGILAPGSMGLKPSSNTGLLQYPECLYSPISNTNKHAPIPQKFLQQCTQKPIPLLRLKMQKAIGLVENNEINVQGEPEKQIYRTILQSLRQHQKLLHPEIQLEYQLLRLIKKMVALATRGETNEYTSLLRLAKTLLTQTKSARILLLGIQSHIPFVGLLSILALSRLITQYTYVDIVTQMLALAHLCKPASELSGLTVLSNRASGIANEASRYSLATSEMPSEKTAPFFSSTL